jgi:hypothetical protein
MKAELKVRPNLIITLEEDKMTDLFELMSAAQEVFSENCGKCGSDDIKFLVRKNDKSTFLELQCKKCWAKLPISPHDNKMGTIYPKRYNKDKETGTTTWLPDQGWCRYNKETGKKE